MHSIPMYCTEINLSINSFKIFGSFLTSLPQQSTLCLLMSLMYWGGSHMKGYFYIFKALGSRKVHLWGGGKKRIWIKWSHHILSFVRRQKHMLQYQTISDFTWQFGRRKKWEHETSPLGMFSGSWNKFF